MYSLICQAAEKVVNDPVEVRFQVGIDTVPARAGANGSGAVAGQNGRVLPVAGYPDPAEDAGETGIDLAPPTSAIDLNPRYTFETFVVGKSNELAHAAARAVSDHPGVTYNPLFIYSGVGLGKTHLLHAIWHELTRKRLSLIYATTEEFTNEYIKAIRDGRTEEFRNRYRSADVLLLDDIQFIIGKEQTQEGFFHTFNSLHMASRQIVITSDRPVTALTLLEDRVQSRLAGGLTVDIQHPDLETRLAILRAKADETGQEFPEDVIQFLAERIHKNIRELEGGLNRVAAYAHLVDSPVTLDLVKASVADLMGSTRSRRVSDQAVIEAVCSYFSVDQQTLKGRRRDKQTALARQVAMYLMREEIGLPLATIGKILGGKDHSTVLHAHHRITQRIDIDPHLRRDILNIREALTQS